jgi:hypothetical protein
MLLKYFLKDFEMVPVAAIITGVTFVSTSHMRCISIIRDLYFRILSASFLIIIIIGGGGGGGGGDGGGGGGGGGDGCG